MGQALWINRAKNRIMDNEGRRQAEEPANKTENSIIAQSWLTRATNREER